MVTLTTFCFFIRIMKWSLLYSGFLLAPFLGTMAYESSNVTVPTPPSNTSVLHTNDLGINQFTSEHTATVTNSNTNSISDDTEQTSQVNTPAFSASSPPVKDSSSNSKPCNCLLDLTNMENHILLILGGLILGCVILLITTMVLAWKVCHLKWHFRDYEPHHIETSTANGKRRADEGHEPNECTIMMSEVSKDNETTKDTAENNKCQETKEERDKNTGTDQSSMTDDAEKSAASGTPDTDKSAANQAKQPESSAEETTNSTAPAKAKDVTDETKNETKTEASETTTTNTEAATAPEGSGSKA